MVEGMAALESAGRLYLAKETTAETADIAAHQPILGSAVAEAAQVQQAETAIALVASVELAALAKQVLSLVHQ